MPVTRYKFGNIKHKDPVKTSEMLNLGPKTTLLPNFEHNMNFPQKSKLSLGIFRKNWSPDLEKKLVLILRIIWPFLRNPKDTLTHSLIPLIRYNIKKIYSKQIWRKVKKLILDPKMLYLPHFKQNKNFICKPTTVTFTYLYIPVFRHNCRKMISFSEKFNKLIFGLKVHI